MPEPGGLGVHLTLDMAGQARFGPTWNGLTAIDYAVDPARAEKFYPAIRRYWPTLPDGALMPSYSGIRPKIVPPAVARQDFLMQGPREHGVAGLINLFGIDSPGLTSSLAIADHVGELAGVSEAASKPSSGNAPPRTSAQTLILPSGDRSVTICWEPISGSFRRRYASTARSDP